MAEPTDSRIAVDEPWQASAIEAFKSGRVPFWRDDPHWRRLTGPEALGLGTELMQLARDGYALRDPETLDWYRRLVPVTRSGTLVIKKINAVWEATILRYCGWPFPTGWTFPC